jgi:probable phosphoglycerate mutase
MSLLSPHPTCLPARLTFVRHGATAPNLAELRCGGDLDVPLTDVGRRQALSAARSVAGLDPGIGLIVTSDLKRTRETATIIAEALGGIDIVVEPGFAERRLGAWNLLPIAATEAQVRSGETPPGGESDREFIRRINAALPTLLPYLGMRPLLVASKGVARALCEIQGRPADASLANGEISHFDLTSFSSFALESRLP